MQSAPPMPPSLSLQGLSPKAKKILFWTLVFLVLPLPWDFIPVLGDMADSVTFLVGALAMVNAERAHRKEAA